MFESLTQGLQWHDWFVLGVLTLGAIQGATVLLWEYLKKEGLNAQRKETKEKKE